MRIRGIVVTAAVIAGAVVSMTQGCGGDDEVPRRSQKGQACQVTNDCADGLACVPVADSVTGICVVGEFRVSVTAKECAVIDCETAADCCPNPPSNCALLEQQCAQSDAGANSTACVTYVALCQCDTTRNDCQSNKCVTRCTTDSQCLGSGRSRCAGGVCVQCAGDSDCGKDQQCLNGTCQAPCKSDGDCSGFNRCIAGRCIESGCQTDRECIAATRNVEATCGTDGKCIVPCASDIECGNPTAYKFFSCIDKQCVYTGCQSDKDCRLFISGPSDASVIGTKQHVVCRDKQRPGVTTAP